MDNPIDALLGPEPEAGDTNHQEYINAKSKILRLTFLYLTNSTKPDTSTQTGRSE